MRPKLRASALAVVLVSLSLMPSIQGAAPGPSPLAVPSVSSASAFLKMSQNIAPTDYDTLAEVYFYTAARIAIDGSLSGINATMQAFLIAQIQATQNPDGGYGDWVGDRSTAGATARALETLALLGAAPLNTAGTTTMLSGLHVVSA